MEPRLFESTAIGAYATKPAWDAVAVEILGVMLERWALTPGRVLMGGYTGTVLEVTGADGAPAVLKIGFPHVEGIAEAVALAAFPSGTAPAVLRQDPWTWAMLLERITPGIPLSEAGLPPDEALVVGAELLARIAASPIPRGVPTLASVVREYTTLARARADEQHGPLGDLGVRELVTAAIDDLDDLALADGTAMVHGDFNPGNILKSGGGWACVDPKPMVGDSAYDLWPLVSQLGAPFGAADPASTLAGQLTLAAGTAGIDPVRAARWAVGRTALNVTWYLAEGLPDLAARDAAELPVWGRARDLLAPPVS